MKQKSQSISLDSKSMIFGSQYSLRNMRSPQATRRYVRIRDRKRSQIRFREPQSYNELVRVRSSNSSCATNCSFITIYQNIRLLNTLYTFMHRSIRNIFNHCVARFELVLRIFKFSFTSIHHHRWKLIVRLNRSFFVENFTECCLTCVNSR